MASIFDGVPQVQGINLQPALSAFNEGMDQRQRLSQMQQSMDLQKQAAQEQRSEKAMMQIANVAHGDPANYATGIKAVADQFPDLAPQLMGLADPSKQGAVRDRTTTYAERLQSAAAGREEAHWQADRATAAQNTEWARSHSPVQAGTNIVDFTGGGAAPPGPAASGPPPPVAANAPPAPDTAFRWPGDAPSAATPPSPSIAAPMASAAPPGPGGGRVVASSPPLPPPGYVWDQGGKALKALPGGPGDPTQKATEQQQRASELYTTVLPQLDTIHQTFGNLADPKNQLVAQAGMLGNAFQSEDYQRATTAVKRVISDYLYNVSGAAVSPSEAQSKADAMIPRFGDKPGQIADKLAYIDDMVKSMYRLTQPPGSLPPLQPPKDYSKSPSGPPTSGVVEDGYRFKGGNPADPNSWEKAN